MTSPWRGRSGEEPSGALQADGEAGGQREEEGKEACAPHAGGVGGARRWPAFCAPVLKELNKGSAGRGEGLWALQGLRPPYRALPSPSPSPEQGTLEFTKHWSFHICCLSLSFPASENTQASRRGGSARLEGAVPVVRGQGDLVKGPRVQWYLIVGGPWGWGQLVAFPPSW